MFFASLRCTCSPLNRGHSDSLNLANTALKISRGAILAGVGRISVANPRRNLSRLLTRGQTKRFRGTSAEITGTLSTSPRKKRGFIVTTTDDSESGFPRIKIRSESQLANASFFPLPSSSPLSLFLRALPNAPLSLLVVVVVVVQ